MGYSKLCRAIVPAAEDNYTHDRAGYKICKITPHHMAGVLTGEQCARLFQNSARNASSNYCIGNDGGIVGCVDEDFRAWTSSSKSNDSQAITIEVSNSEKGGDWPISEEAWESLVNLCVDICQRYNFRLEYTGNKNGSLTKHNMFAATNCPGPYLEARLEQLANIVNEELDGNQPKPEPVPVPTTRYNVGEVVTINGIYKASNSTQKLKPARDKGTITKIVAGALNPYLLDNGNLGWTNDACIVSQQVAQPAPAKKSVNEVAQEVIAGKWGTGADRKNRLTAAGYNYNEVQNEVNNILKGKPSQPSNKKSNEQIAKEVIEGKWGNGKDRKKKIEAAGYNYNEIQKIVNKMI